MKRVVCAIALATGTGAIFGASSQQASADPIPVTATSGLQLTIVPPAAPTSDSASTLDVSFRGGIIRSVELFVDSNRVFKKSVKFSTAQGKFNLKVDSQVLPEGDHEVLVVATDVDGNTASSSFKIHVAGPEVDGIAQFAYPRRNAMVQNVVPIELKLDPGIKAPYVAYLLDNDFLSIRNYAPYVYNWDSTHVPDGPHTLGVEVYDSATQQLLKKMSVQVIVKNVGGFTTIQPTTPTISSNTTRHGIRRIIGESIGEPVNNVIEDPTGLSRTATAPRNSYELRSVEPRPTNLFTKANPLPTSIIPSIDPLPDSPVRGSSSSSVASPGAPRPMSPRGGVPGIPGILAEPEAAPIELEASDARISRIVIKPSHSGNIAARPRISDGPRATVRPIVIAHYLTPPVSFVRSHRTRGFHSFDVSFNNSLISFDVQPRVEHGTALAPFRAIFEHSGGSVQWFGKTQTIRAVSANRLIEFRIGQDTALVNNKVVKLAYKPYVENGRAIVPLSFVRDAMNVKVTYSAQNSKISLDGKI